MRRIGIVGTGFVGGSLGLALRARDYEVVAFDADAQRLERAEALGVCDETLASVEDVAAADLAVVAVPVGAVADVALRLLRAGAPVVTDVGSVKGPIVRAVESEAPDAARRFVGGHPMAGSEQDGVEGADAALFTGAVWVVTPGTRTDSDALRAVRRLLTDVGAEMLALDADDHDALVAVVSHVPQLAASTLMDLAASRGTEHDTLLRLAAGGFRDMTRIAAGDAAIWPDICVANRDAIVDALDAYLAALGELREQVRHGERTEILTRLERARTARRNLPTGAEAVGPLVELRLPVPDRPGVLADVTRLAGSLGVNIVDLEIVHSTEGGGGVLVLTLGESSARVLEPELTAAGYHPSTQPIE